MRFKLLITIIAFMLWTIAIQSTSKIMYEGVSWNEKVTLWRDVFYFNGKKSNYYFDNKHGAAKTRNLVYKKMGILPQNPENSEIPNRHNHEKTSQYKGVYYHKKNRKWYVLVNQKGQKQIYGGLFNDELDAAKRMNQLCEEMEIPHKNPRISEIPNEQYQKESMDWFQNLDQDDKDDVVQLLSQSIQHYGNINEDVAQDMEQKFGINPSQTQQLYKFLYLEKKKSKTSQHKGVYWFKQRHKWRVQLYSKGDKKKSGGLFNDELDAAKKVNQLCEELGIAHKNPGISSITIEQSEINDPESTNSVTSAKISKAEHDNNKANKNKRKHETDLIRNDNSVVEKYYFYENLLK